MDACPTGCLFSDDDHVGVHPEKCIGCRMCMAACPYTGVRSFNWDEPKYSVEHAVGDADIAPHQKHVVEKCTFCKNLIDRGDVPACMQLCPGRARYWGDLDDPESDVSKLRAAKKTYKLKDVGNHPGVDYAMDKCAWKGDE